jgi:hypothetical protein
MVRLPKLNISSLLVVVVLVVLMVVVVVLVVISQIQAMLSHQIQN